MLDKQSEHVLRYAIFKYNNDFCADITIIPEDVKMNAHHLNNICQNLYRNGYLSECSYVYSDKEASEITLTYKGISYFQYKKMERVQFLMPIILETILSLAVIAVSIIAIA